jgi:hypothetical protein
MFSKFKQFLGKAYRTAKLFTNPGKSISNLIQDTIKDISTQYPPQVRNIISRYGKDRIIDIQLCKEVVSENTEFLLKALAGTKTWEEAKQKYGFDKFYHLFMIATLENGTRLHIEKNEIMRISNQPRACDNALSMGSVNIPLSVLLDRTRQRMGDNSFFTYDPLGNNCQNFISELLKTMNMWNNTSRDFVYQDINGLRSELPSYTKYLAKGLTNVGAFFNTAYQKTKDYIENGEGGQETEGLDN